MILCSRKRSGFDLSGVVSLSFSESLSEASASPSLLGGDSGLLEGGTISERFITSPRALVRALIGVEGIFTVFSVAGLMVSARFRSSPRDLVSDVN
jgi:hypothetical protein